MIKKLLFFLSIFDKFQALIQNSSKIKWVLHLSCKKRWKFWINYGLWLYSNWFLFRHYNYNKILNGFKWLMESLMRNNANSELCQRLSVIKVLKFQFSVDRFYKQKKNWEILIFFSHDSTGYCSKKFQVFFVQQMIKLYLKHDAQDIEEFLIRQTVRIVPSEKLTLLSASKSAPLDMRNSTIWSWFERQALCKAVFPFWKINK